MQKKALLKNITKGLLWILVILILALGIAYWTAPSWVPGQVQRFLPSSVQIENLELKRPGLTSTQIDHLVLNLGDDPQYKIEFSNVKLGYSLWQRKLTSISAETAHLKWPEAEQSSTSSEALQVIPLPRLPVSDISVDQLTVEGLTLQHITATDIRLEENNDSVAVTSNIQFLDKLFSVSANAERNNDVLSKIESDITQGKNQLNLTALPISSKHWEFESSGTFELQDLYPQPGIAPVNAMLNGAVDFSNELLVLKLEPSSKITTTANIRELKLTKTLQDLLAEYHVKTNLEQAEANYQIALQPLTETTLSFLSPQSLLTLEQGQFNIQLKNPSISADIQLAQLQLNLAQALSAESQKADLTAQVSVQNLKGTFESPDHSASSDLISLNLDAHIDLASSQVLLSTKNGRIKLGKIDYQGNNSTASLTPNQWSLKGSSKLNFNNPESPPQNNQHEWQLETDKAISGNLQLSNEQFTAKEILANLQFKQNKQLPHGKLSGSYQISSVALQQQPLKLDSLKGNLDFSLNKTPQGKLNFSNARYNSKQIGISNIAGELNWNKKPQAFVAKGALQHDKSNIPFDYLFNLESSQHNLKIDQSSLPVSTITSWLNILKDYPQLSFNSGQLKIDSLDGDPIGLLFDGKLKLDNFNLNYDEFYVRNWAIEDSLTSSSKLGGTLKSHIDSIELATDISITDVTFFMPHTINSLVITDLKGKLLKGTIEIPQLAVNDDGIPPFTAYLKAIDIGALLNALNSEKLKLTGLFDFTLPLILSGEGQQINDGQFKALGEGVVRLESDKGKEANIAFQALENFHYKEFSGSLDYNLAGDYVVELHVLGSNPNLYNGFPVKLDLTLRGKLPELLYSMLVSGDMTKPILDDLQQKQILNIQP